VSKAAVVAFGVRTAGSVLKSAKRAGVSVMHFQVIYKLLDGLEGMMMQRLTPEYEEVQVGTAQVLMGFVVKTTGTKQQVAGSRVTDGVINLNSKVSSSGSGSSGSSNGGSRSGNNGSSGSSNSGSSSSGSSSSGSSIVSNNNSIGGSDNSNSISSKR